MSDIHIYRIEQHIKDEFIDKINLDDVKRFPRDEQDKMFLSRGQCALAIKYLAKTSAEIAAESVFDGFGDNSIDGIHIDSDEKILYLLQSKWISKGNSVPKKNEIQSFLSGVDDLIKLKFDKFTDRLLTKKDDLIKCFKDPSFRINVVLVYTSVQQISGESLACITDQISEYNDSTDLFGYKFIDQKELYKAILSGLELTPINLKEITLYNWGKHSEPYESFFGEIQAEQLAKLWAEHGQTLLNKNLRQFKDSSQVNELIKITLSKEALNFWYFNNGITVLCRNVGKGAIHGNDRAAGVFNFDDVSIVNGAQTYGSIGEAYKHFPDQVKNAKVQIRFINLTNAEEGFEKKITRFTNTQNKIENKDFASLDPEQERLKHELLLDKKEYVFRTGEKIKDKLNGCDIEEATFALACYHPDINLSVMAHRNIGSIWLDIDRPPYRTIFNRKTTGQRLWRVVVVYRVVKERLSIIEFAGSNDIKPIAAVHGESLILFKVYQLFGIEKIESSAPKFAIDKKQIEAFTEKVLDVLCEGYDKLFPTIYLNSFFKNADKVAKLASYMDNKLGLEKTLFSDLNGN